MLSAFLVAAACEELGWSGYVLEPLQARGSARRAALVIGGVWAVWHVVPLIQAGRSFGWIAWWGLGTVSMRVLFVWLYNGAGRSVFAPSVCHALHNLAWMLVPVHGSHYDPRVDGLVTAAAAAVVIAATGGRLKAS